MTQPPIDFAEINRAALTHIHAVLGRIVPGGKVSSSEYVVRNPRRADKKPGSFKINLKSGKWCDFSTGDAGGDIISLLAYVEGMSQVQAARVLANLLGLGNGGRT